MSRVFVACKSKKLLFSRDYVSAAAAACHHMCHQHGPSLRKLSCVRVKHNQCKMKKKTVTMRKTKGGQNGHWFLEETSVRSVLSLSPAVSRFSSNMSYPQLSTTRIDNKRTAYAVASVGGFQRFSNDPFSCIPLLI